MARKSASGFTLIELVVAIAIVAILAAIALPAYQNYVLRARRVDGREMLQRVAAAQERFYTNRNRYTADLTTAAGLNMSSVNSESGHYTVTINVDGTGQTYTLRATPQAGQAEDVCGDLTVNNVGVRAYNGAQTNGSCW